MPELWAGTDAGKAEHHCVVIGIDGRRKLSRRVANDETGLLNLIGDVLALSEGAPVTWAIDLNAGGAALLITLLADHGQQVLYIPGRTVHHAAGSYRGEGKQPDTPVYGLREGVDGVTKALAEASPERPAAFRG
ncbi:IS110 family transposase [Streptomyces sp. NBC_00047]|nr:IS110 family transposase [Streptomyces sp. NBC_00047]